MEKMGNSTPLPVKTQRSTLMLWMVWARSELEIATSIQVFNVSCFSEIEECGYQSRKKLKTLLTSQVTTYLGTVGLNFSKDFSNLLIKRCSMIAPWDSWRKNERELLMNFSVEALRPVSNI